MERIFASSRTEFLEILSLGSLENYGIWHNIFDALQELHLELERLKVKGQTTKAFETSQTQILLT